MHVENELVEFVTTGEQEYEEVIKEYEEDVLIQEKAPWPLTWLWSSTVVRTER